MPCGVVRCEQAGLEYVSPAATGVVVMCAACVAYERLAALFGVSKLGWSVCRLTATGVVVMCAAYTVYGKAGAL